MTWMRRAASKKQDAAVCEAMRAAASCFAVPPDKRGTPIGSGLRRVPTGVAYGWCHSAWMQFQGAGGGTSSKAFGSRLCASRSTIHPPGGGPPLKRRKPRLPPSRQLLHLRWFIHSPQTESSGIGGGFVGEIGRNWASNGLINRRPCVRPSYPQSAPARFEVPGRLSDQWAGDSASGMQAWPHSQSSGTVLDAAPVGRLAAGSGDGWAASAGEPGIRVACCIGIPSSPCTVERFHHVRCANGLSATSLHLQWQCMWNL